MTLRRWVEYLAAILAGNAIYFLVLFPDLPPVLQHRVPTLDQTIPIHLDLGLLLDFVLCIVVYGVIRMASRHAQRWNERDVRLRQSLRDQQPRGS